MSKLVPFLIATSPGTASHVVLVAGVLSAAAFAVPNTPIMLVGPRYLAPRGRLDAAGTFSSPVFRPPYPRPRRPNFP
jgi:hypothetical protein